MEKITDLLQTLSFEGLAVGFATFLIIGIFHPIVIKSHYYFGIGSRWYFVIAGVVMCVLSLLVHHTIVSTLLGVTAFSCFWSVKEIVEQEERVRKGWFPANPKRENKHK